MQKTRVLIVDDSAAVRQALTAIMSADPRLEVIGSASDPFVAARRIQTEVPDVITLDVEMQRMDGITFLRKIMSQHPIPVVMCSSLTEEGSATLLQALEAGAVDVILKPRVDVVQHLQDASVRICDAVRAAGHARLNRRPPPRSAVPDDKARVQARLTADAVLPPPPAHGAMARTTEKVICVGASTGGTEALRHVFESLPPDCPGIVVVQHMPERFTESFARRLDSLCACDVKEAADGDTVLRGRVLIAPGNRHVLLQRSGARYHVAIKDGPLVSRHRPSVDVLFRSAARTAGSNAVGIILTGMGDDGAQGMRELKAAGASTVAQDEATSVVFGMPREAIATGCIDRVLSLGQIAAEIMRLGNR
ncbi:protein-glutamate methylesterase/protein-glutamine glutaminase [Parapedomonas caeni]